MSNESLNALSLKPDYVLVIEYLNPSEPRTGAQLVEKYSPLRLGKPRMDLKICQTGVQVLEEIKKAEKSISEKGVPVVHIESHGSEWKRGGKELQACIGHSAGREKLAWREVLDVLRPLNIATNFNLLVVVSTCFGAEAIRGIVQDFYLKKEIRPLPFMATVGFEETVGSGSLLSAMTCFYQGIFDKKLPLEIAVSNANKSLQNKEKMNCDWALKVLKNSLSTVNLRDENGWNDIWEEYCCTSSLPRKSKIQFVDEVSNFESQAMESFYSELLAYKTHPANRERFDEFLKSS